MSAAGDAVQRVYQRSAANNEAAGESHESSSLLRSHSTSHSNSNGNGLHALQQPPTTPSKREHHSFANGGPLLSIPSVRSFRTFAWLFILLILALSAVYVYFLLDPASPPHSAAEHTPSAYSAQQAAYAALMALPLSQQLNLTTGPLSLHIRSLCHPFLFPRPTSRLFITSWPNHGAGLGHQFGEWLYGAVLSHTQGVTYVHTGFLGNSARWADWLGSGAGEDSEADVHNAAVHVSVVERLDSDHYNKSNTRTVEDWVKEQRAVHEQESSQLFAMLDTPALQLLNDADPVTTATLLRVYRIHVPHPASRYSCHPDVNLLLRQKYCAARMHAPVSEDLYVADRAAGAVVVAFHLRCGDSCYNPFRTTPFPSVVRTIRLMYDTIKQAGLGESVFHLFSQPPQNDTAENRFGPLLADSSLTGIALHGHWYTHAHTTLHHLVTADILIGAQSSFSWVGSLLHHTVAMGPVETCRWQVAGYRKETGEFEPDSLLRQYNHSRAYRQQYGSMDDCRAMKKWTYELRPDELDYQW